MDSTLISTRPDEGTLSLSRARRAALGSFAGAVVDWYDFLLYGITAALVFNREFFPQVSPAMGTLAAFATFGVGFLFRPLGGVIFGHFGDRLGRKRMLMLTVWMMGIATALIGILPSFSTIGWWALMNPLMILVKIIKLRWIHILSYDQMVSRKINNQTTRCANSIFYTTLFTNSAPNYT
ncbi:hypothetical protein IY32_19640 [Escherichia coli]|nr:hypothetical protein IY33_19570 [Escherichia coli]KIQ44764.1 hypothetical protein IY32_19640 [Escherichia coli]